MLQAIFYRMMKIGSLLLVSFPADAVLYRHPLFLFARSGIRAVTKWDLHINEPHDNFFVLPIKGITSLTDFAILKPITYHEAFAGSVIMLRDLGA